MPYTRIKHSIRTVSEIPRSLDNAFCKETGYGAILSIDFLDFIDGYIVFEECLRFRADDVTVLAHSSKELDFSKYTDQ